MTDHKTVIDYSRPMPAGFTIADPFAILRAGDRCDGSLQQTMTAQAGPCPVCGSVVAVVDIDGRPHVVEHRPRRGADALPIGLGL